MKKLLLILPFLFFSLCMSQNIIWDYLLFVQYWPGTWITNDNINNSGFTNNYFNVHGIWPEYYNGSYPAFCNNSAVFDTDKLKPIYHDLAIYWTNYHNVTAFLEHEFFKHGTCASTDYLFFSEFEYFNAGLILRNKYDLFKTLTNANIYPSNQDKYYLEEIFNAIKYMTNYNPAITCDDNGYLNEIIICMDPNLNLMDCPHYENHCSYKKIVINVIN
ncbi:T2 family ribonuclease [Tupanvirus soda lake]|uniref:T2 family ribonuclease n=2 Tax=Tupanvirus TaxID=2094720 RepID=A0A6N1NTP7_9VIRU|nr:T2 family ribonuclease [Tupanvirus soda lake]QKU34958.1 T2 family ribonuclease [Tupanvirus soda lake]